MVHPSLHFAAARFALEVATTDELINAAHAALDDSIYSYSLGELATFRQPTWYEISPLFVNALKELEIPMPSLDEAIDAALCFHLSAIAEGDVTPELGASELHAVSMTIDRLSRQQISEELVRQLREFGDHYYLYDDARDWGYSLTNNSGQSLDAVIKELDDQCIQQAREWFRNRWWSRIDPEWLTSTVTALAKGIYAERAFHHLPILADALQDASCDADELLTHLRHPGPHTRGCWVLDLVLGKS